MSSLPRWDQNDYRAANDALCIEATRLEATLRAAGKDVPARPAQKANVVESYEAMTGHMAQLHALVSLSIMKPSAAATRATQQQAEPPDPAAPAVPGALPAPAAVAPTQVIVVRPNPSATISNPQFNPDAKILAARGVKTVAELNAKTQRERDLGLRVSLED